MHYSIMYNNMYNIMYIMMYTMHIVHLIYIMNTNDYN